MILDKKGLEISEVELKIGMDGGQGECIKKKNASVFMNCVKMPLFKDKSSTKTIDVCAIGELHCCTGPFNFIFKQLRNRWEGPQFFQSHN